MVWSGVWLAPAVTVPFKSGGAGDHLTRSRLTSFTSARIEQGCRLCLEPFASAQVQAPEREGL